MQSTTTPKCHAARISAVHTPPQRVSAAGRLGSAGKSLSQSRIVTMRGYSLGPPLRVVVDPSSRRGLGPPLRVRVASPLRKMAQSAGTSGKTPVKREDKHSTPGPTKKVTVHAKPMSPLRKILPKKTKVEISVPIPSFGTMTIKVESTEAAESSGESRQGGDTDGVVKNHYVYI